MTRARRTHGEHAAAYERIFALSAPNKARREYPEVSFALIEALVTGLMGVDVEAAQGSLPATLRTVSRLIDDQSQATLAALHMQGGTLDVSHQGHRQSMLRNRGSQTLRWRAEFPGRFERLSVDGELRQATIRSGVTAEPVSAIAVDVGSGTAVTVQAPRTQ